MDVELARALAQPPPFWLEGTKVAGFSLEQGLVDLAKRLNRQSLVGHEGELVLGSKLLLV